MTGTSKIDPAAAPILTARADDPDAFDHALVGAPSLAWLVEGTGRGHFALWYAGAPEVPRGEDRPEWAIGYAASWDGATWSRLDGNRLGRVRPSQLELCDRMGEAVGRKRDPRLRPGRAPVVPRRRQRHARTDGVP